MKNILAAALANTSIEYINKVLGERNPNSPTQAGSSFNTDLTVEDLKKAFEGEAVEVDMGSERFSDCLYFRLPIPGKVGVVDLRSLQQDLKVDLLDPKNTLGTKGGSVECYLRNDQSSVDRSKVDYSIVILGREEGQEYKVWTVFPGPVTPRPGPIGDASLLGKTVTVAEALRLGFKIAKVAI